MWRCRDGNEALIATSTANLDTARQGLFKQHYLLLPCEGEAGRQPALWVAKLAGAEEVIPPGLPTTGQAEEEVPGAIRQAVCGQLGKVPMIGGGAAYHSRLSSHAFDFLEMLVRESKPVPQPVPANQAAAAGAAAAAAVAAPPAEAAKTPLPEPAERQVLPAGPGRNSGQVKQGGAPAAAAGGARAVPTGKRAARGQANPKGALELKRVQR